MDIEYKFQNGGLPDKFSDFLELALQDLEDIEMSRFYNVDMGRWHVPSASGVRCTVCLAGAMMARHCGVPIKSRATPSDTDIHSELHGVSAAQFGLYDEAILDWLEPEDSQVDRLGLDTTGWSAVDIHGYEPDYEADPDMWREALEMFIADLREVGL